MIEKEMKISEKMKERIKDLDRIIKNQKFSSAAKARKQELEYWLFEIKKVEKFMEEGKLNESKHKHSI